jgi:hypothetical protein
MVETRTSGGRGGDSGVILILAATLNPWGIFLGTFRRCCPKNSLGMEPPKLTKSLDFIITPGAPVRASPTADTTLTPKVTVCVHLRGTADTKLAALVGMSLWAG